MAALSLLPPRLGVFIIHAGLQDVALSFRALLLSCGDVTVDRECADTSANATCALLVCLLDRAALQVPHRPGPYLAHI